jgi:hypothetical protein
LEACNLVHRWLTVLCWVEMLGFAAGVWDGERKIMIMMVTMKMDDWNKSLQVYG